MKGREKSNKDEEKRAKQEGEKGEEEKKDEGEEEVAKWRDFQSMGG